MKLPQLHSLLPSRGMMFVALGLSLTIGWYFYNTSSVADHLTKRNFNFLNQIGSNIDASVDAAGQIAKFNPEKMVADIYRNYDEFFEAQRRQYQEQSESKRKSPLALKPPSPENILRKSVREVLDELKSRLLRDGYLTSDSQNITVEISSEIYENKQHSPKLPWLKLPAKVCEGEECESTKYGCMTSTKPTYAQPELDSVGINSTFSLQIGIPEIDWDECKYKGKVPKKYVRARFSLTIAFTDIEGLGNGETFFDTVLLASSEGKSNGSPVIFSNTDEQLYSEGLFHLLDTSSRFERFRSIRAFENLNRTLPIGPPNPKIEQASKVEPLAFTQSTVIPIEVGGFSKLAFAQPFSSKNILDDNLVLIGIVAESSFNKLRYAVPYNWLSNALLLLLLGLLSLNFARLKLIKNKGILRRSDVYISVFSLAGVASLFVVFLIQILASWEFGALFDKQSKRIHAGLSAQFEHELDAKIQKIGVNHANITQGKYRNSLESSDCFIASDSANQVALDTTKDELLGQCSMPEKNVFKLECNTNGFPEVTSQFILDETGTQHCYYFTHNKQSVKTGFSVPTRDYFRKIHDDEAWSTNIQNWSPELQAKWGDFFQGKFYLERIESKVDGAQQTALSLPFEDGALVAVTKFYSLENTALPPGYGFSVFDNKSGLVLFHSNESRNLRENFYRATDDDPELKSAVLSGSNRTMSLTYKGELVDAEISPLGNTPWTLVTFYRNSVVDAFNFHFGTSALVLAGAYISVFLVVLPGLILLLRWLYRMTFSIHLEDRLQRVDLPQWLFPERGKSSAQRSLSIALLQLLAAYIVCIWFFDLPDARLWILLVVIVVPCCWLYFLHMKPEVTEKVPVGKTTGYSKMQQGDDSLGNGVISAFTYYRFNITLSVLLLAVLPTLLLSNENYDTHQKQWLEFSHWFNVEKLKQRSASYLKMNSRFKKSGLPCDSDAAGKRARLGIHIPGAGITLDELIEPESMSVDKAPGLSLVDYIAKHALARESEIKVLMEDAEQDCVVQAMLTPGETANEKSDDARRPSEYLDSMLSVLPSLGVEGAVLDGLDVKGTLYDKSSSKLQIDSRDPATGMRYISEFDYPQTRPQDPLGIFLWLLFYLFVVVVSAVVAASLVGFLIRKFLSGSFEENLLSLTTIPIASDLVDGAIVVHPSDVESQDAYKALLHILALNEKDFENITGSESPEEQVVVTETSQKIVVIKDFLGVTHEHATSSEVLDLVRSRLRLGFSLIILSDIDPNHWAKSDQVTDEAFELWEGIINSLSTFMLPISGEGRSLHNRRYVLHPRVYRRAWRKCSEDEQMVLGGLCHEGIINPQNEFTLRSLYRRRLVDFRNSHFEFGDPGWREYVMEKLSREEFRERARRYKNSVWISFRGPMILILLVLVMFIAYVAQDEMRLLFSLIASIGAGAGALTALGNSLRSMASRADGPQS